MNAAGRRGLTEAGCLLTAAGAAALMPWAPVNRAAARLFYRPSIPGGPWQPAEPVPWGLLASLTSWVAAGLALAGVGLLLRAAFAPPGERSLRPGLMVVLGLALGPGLLVNAVFKDHWHRPRPRQTETLGGDFAYVAPLAIGPAGKSFPCGHASVGFAVAALGYALRPGRPRAARYWFAASPGLGALLGLGRVATGAHFVSDVVWAAILTYGSLIVVCYAVLGMPWRQATAGGAARLAGALGGIALAGGLGAFFMPFRETLAPRSMPLPAGAPWNVRLAVEVGHARVVFEPVATLEREAHYDGFGLPGGRIEETMVVDPEGRSVRLRLRPRGRFADLEGVATFRVPAAATAALEVEVKDGMLTLEDRSGGASLPPIDCRIRPGALRLRGDLRRDQVRVVER